MDDHRNLGGQHLIDNQHDGHLRALSQAKSVITEHLSSPHAHIKDCKGLKTDFERAPGSKKHHFRPKRGRKQLK